MRGTSIAVTTAAILVLGLVPAAAADQATFGPGWPGDLAPGQTVTYAADLYVGASGAPNVVYENAASFAIDETVTATLSPRVWPADFGTVELIGPTSVVARTSADWDGTGTLVFAPAVAFRYTAPSGAQVGCDESPGDRFHGDAGVDIQFVGDKGTRAHTDATISPYGLGKGAAFPVAVVCPETPAPTRTPTPTSDDRLLERIHLDAAAWVGGEALGDGPWRVNEACGSGGFDAGGNPPVVYWYRCAVEFRLPTLPSGADVRSVSLAMHAENLVADTTHIDLGGYVGDGTGALEDLTAGERILRPRLINEATNLFDVTAFVVRLIEDGRSWAGFNLSSRGTRDVRGWSPPSGADPPRLTIIYGRPIPSPGPTGEPAPTEPAPMPIDGDQDGGSGGQGGTRPATLPETATVVRPAEPRQGTGAPTLFGLFAVVVLGASVMAARSRRIR